MMLCNIRNVLTLPSMFPISVSNVLFGTEVSGDKDLDMSWYGKGVVQQLAQTRSINQRGFFRPVIQIYKLRKT